MEFLIDLGMFLAKAIIIVTAVVIILGSLASGVHKHKEKAQGHIEIDDMTEKFKDLKNDLLQELMDKKSFKESQKQQKKDEKLKKKDQKNTENEDVENKRLFVCDFDGDVHAHAVTELREEINAVLSVAKENDAVLLRLNSPGGVVHGYGHAASQLKRITDKKIFLTVAVDEVAASGGYMMACVANKIIAAPFAIIGSIGVIAEMPNFNKLLKKHDIDFEQHTAGEYKRTITMLGENTDSGREKFKQELNEAHDLFKEWVKSNRDQVDIDKVATGEHWFGKQAIDLNLIDEIGTSDDFIMSQLQQYKIYHISFQQPKKLANKLSRFFQETLQKSIDGLSRYRSRW